jgi:hypothetical protein
MRVAECTSRSCQKACNSYAHEKAPVKVPNICEKNILVVIANSFALNILQEASFSDDSQFSNSSESSSDFSATSASDFHHRSMMPMLQKLGPALDQMTAWQQAVNPAIFLK